MTNTNSESNETEIQIDVEEEVFFIDESETKAAPSEKLTRDSLRALLLTGLCLVTNEDGGALEGDVPAGILPEVDRDLVSRFVALGSRKNVDLHKAVYYLCEAHRGGMKNSSMTRAMTILLARLDQLFKEREEVFEDAKKLGLPLHQIKHMPTREIVKACEVVREERKRTAMARLQQMLASLNRLERELGTKAEELTVIEGIDSLQNKKEADTLEATLVTMINEARMELAKKLEADRHLKHRMKVKAA